MTRLEVGFSARSAEDLRASTGRPPLASMPIEYLTRSIETVPWPFRRRADRGQHRALPIPDLSNAATAELPQVTVLHLDQDYERVADISGQPVERLRLI